MELSAQTVLVRAYVGDWLKANPISDAVLLQGIRRDQGADGRQGVQGAPHPRREGRRGEGDHRALQKGEKFEKLAERSKDPGSKANGGDLDWNAPATS
jgi:peptidyl-prolyl cis-trans isomerase C